MAKHWVTPRFTADAGRFWWKSVNVGRSAVRLVVCCAAVLIVGACGDDDGGGNGGSGGDGGNGGSTTTSSSSGAGPCATTACNDSSPDQACEDCMDANCAAEGAACEADSQSGTCIGCAEFLGGGSWDDTCDDSKMIFATFLECVCGDGQTAGACG